MDHAGSATPSGGGFTKLYTPKTVRARNSAAAAALPVHKRGECRAPVFLLRSLRAHLRRGQASGRFSSSLPPSFPQGCFAAALYSAPAGGAR